MAECKQVPHLALTHGQVLWVLARGRPPTAKLEERIKYLRRLGVPFRREELGRGRGVRVVYSFEHLVELEMARLLRARGMDLGDVAGMLVWLRDDLRPLYRQAYTEARTGLGKPTAVLKIDQLPFEIQADGVTRLRPTGELFLNGCFLDLGITYRDDGRITHNPVRLLGPWDAIHELSIMGRDFTYKGFIALSKVVEELMNFASRAPEIKPGPA